MNSSRSPLRASEAKESLPKEAYRVAGAAAPAARFDDVFTLPGFQVHRGRRVSPPFSGLRPRAALTLIELAMAMAVLSIAFLMYSSTSLSVNRERAASRELAIASDAARDAVETLRSESLSRILALYNHDPADDPGGPGTAPGNRFAVPRLEPIPGMPDGMIGEVQLPESEVGDGIWQLREDLVRPELGMPRDLNGDSIIDAEDHALDYILLPVRVRLDWQGRFGPRSIVMDTMIVDYRR